MTQDPLASGAISSVLAWLVATPIMVSVLIGAFGLLFEKTDESIPRWYLGWVSVCVLVFSPFRYIVLLLLIGAAYPVQSPAALASTIPLMFYTPIVFGVLVFVGIGLPILVTHWVAFRDFKTPVVGTGRLIVGALTAPVCMAGGYLLFFWILPFAGASVHWLRATDVIGATNGPASFAYEHVLKIGLPLPLRTYYVDVTESDRDMLRNHVASFFLGDRAEAHYVMLAYPDLYAKLTTAAPQD